MNRLRGEDSVGASSKHSFKPIQAFCTQVISITTTPMLSATTYGRPAIESDHRHFDILIELGRMLSMHGERRSYVGLARSIRSILRLSAVTVWVFDKQHHVLVNEAIDADPTQALKESDLAIDEQIAHVQARRSTVLMATNVDTCELSLPDDYKLDFISLPIYCRNILRGTLNLYNQVQQPWFFSDSKPDKDKFFFEGLAGQMAVFIENRELELDSTFYKEVHHRIKNSLETAASLLRMQIRRLDRVKPEQAIEDSISRIMTIALVHETLTQGEIGFVDASLLIRKIAGLLTSDLPHRPEITLAITGESPMILSRNATTLALIANELIQNALSHGVMESEDGRIGITLNFRETEMEFVVTDNGKGLPKDFDSKIFDSLGLTIVSTLVTEDHCGNFSLTQNPEGPGTIARVLCRRAKVGSNCPGMAQ